MCAATTAPTSCRRAPLCCVRASARLSANFPFPQHTHHAAPFAAVAIVSGIASAQNYVGEREFASLTALKQDRPVQVQRVSASGESHVVQVSVHDLVVGDVVLLAAGDILAADGVLLEGHRVGVNQSNLTGESDVVAKSSADPVLLGGSVVVEGYGSYLVVCVGEESQYGRITKEVQEREPPRTPLEEKLDDLADLIGWAGLGVGGLTTAALSVMWLLGQEDPLSLQNEWIDLLKFFVVGLVIVVVAVPEGLPLAVTISLQFSMQRMVADRILVREMKACETSGSANVICSDKTGTLTENKMKVVDAWLAAAPDTAVQSPKAALAPAVAQELAKAIALNTSAHEQEGDAGFMGNPTEVAMLNWLAAGLGCEVEAMRDAAPTRFRIPFDSLRKCMTTVTAGQGGDFAVYCKGAPELLLPQASQVARPDGSVVELTEGEVATLQDRIAAMASAGLRTIAVMSKTIDAQDAVEGLGIPGPADAAGVGAEEEEAAWEGAADNGALENDFTLLAILGIADPIRAAVPGAVAKCNAAGVRVIMVTGDYAPTACSIAKEAGILKEEGLVMQGHEFRAKTEAQRRDIVPRLAVLARSSPNDKLLLVNTLLDMGAIVSVTGDGTNDAPALRAATVGLAMGIAGTEVAKEASDIVVLDDNFASIVQSVKWGRAIVENVRKFLQFQLTVNVSACLLTFIVACLNGGDMSKFPLNSVELLWVNLIMDSFAALALATEPPNEALLQRLPEGRGTPLITTRMWKHLLGHGLVQTAVLLVLTMHPDAADWVGAPAFGDLQHMTFIFNVFVFMQVFNMFNCRKIHDEGGVFKDLGDSTLLTGVLAVIVGGQYAMVTFGGDVVQTVPLTTDQWLLSMAIGACSLPLGALLRLLPVGSEANVDAASPASKAAAVASTGFTHPSLASAMFPAAAKPRSRSSGALKLQ